MANYNAYDGPHRDLRELLERAEAADELLRVDGVEWNLEMGTLTELIHHAGPNPPAILFDKVPGYPEGFRVVSGAGNSSKRLALTLGFPVPRTPMDVVRAYRDRMKTHAPISPETVDDGPVLQNVDRDDEVDLLKFPVPFLHERDGGRYIGTDDLVIMHDPEDDWVNVGTYRSMLHDRRTVGLWMSPGKQGRQIREKYFREGKPCPVLISCGHDPLLSLGGGNEVRFGLSEFAWAGGHRGRPVRTIRSERYGLPMPADSEIVLEGAMHPGDTKAEGPFGEFTGYYASEVSDEPVVRVERVYYRNDPILTMASPMRPPSDFSFSKCVMKSGMIWDEIEHAGLNDVQGVWCHEAGAARLFNVVSIRQAYGGHARQAALLAASCQSGSYLGRYVVVVDEDIDPTDLFEVLWAISTRSNPVDDIEILRQTWSGPLDPMLRPGERMNSRAIIDACRPFEWRDEFAPVARASPELRDEVREKYRAVLSRFEA
ncbi:MAG: UbiD family decarboxylase [Vicinamibacterales bacterium]|jgi:4-hydroxy-3-polyprenylbenzoate decarboxylase|nr:ubiquinone biosynthesis protein UbiD [Acidobacteriota bacterium]MDP7294835.1 UbiD family decarboxylase [Vicinamibacterales bacterium]MDP7472804.1 UbiD family decarboxylase [Vicinamibacterales bacterium]MDP7671458.1 UbiD family decarboxylase [Vicinamibacterales bacterium]HJO38932.1 UbiD family decarboxylase [Vicinamibacterales bacterium]|tara:strand:- start:1268 stop:2725 length:1458 start_codon:yes stop_codon:yes gene_type:complete